MRASTLVWAAAAVTFGHARPAGAQYRAEQFTSANGLPENTVSGIAQTPDGYLWFSTYDGLVRYDGIAFTIYDRGNTPAMGETLFAGLGADAAGTLWGVTPSGVLEYRDHAFSWHPRAIGGGPMDVPRADRVPGYVPLRFGHWRVEGDSVVEATDGSGRRYAVAMVRHAPVAQPYEDHRGRLWTPTRGDTIVELDSAGAHPLVIDPGAPDLAVQVAGEDRDGTIWFDDARALIAYKDGRFTILDGPSPVGSRQIRVGFVDRDGVLWVGTNDNGLFRVTRRLLTSYSVADGVFQRFVYPVTQDRAGRIWMGAGRGLTVFDRGRFSTLLIQRTAAGHFRLVPSTDATQALDSNAEVPRSLLADRAGDVLVGVRGAVITIRDRAIVRTVGTPPGPPDAILEARDGSLWLASSSRVLHLVGDSIHAYDVTRGLPASGAHLLFQDSRGTVWVGTRAGLARFTGGAWVLYTTKDGLAGNNIRSMTEDPDGTLWIGTFDSGITRDRDGHFASVTTRDGLFCNGAFAMLLDPRDNFWVSCNRGIYRVSRRQLNDVLDGRAPSVSRVSYGAADGMRSTEANGGRQPAGVRAADGTLWFPTEDGVVAIDPTADSAAARAPAALIEAIAVDGSPVPLGSGVELTPRQTDLEFTYTAPTSIHADNLQFRYRLRGVSDRWIAADTRRRVHYSHLAPGHYTFDVAAASPDGRWGARPASVAVTVDPYFYQTSWFLALCAAVVALSAGGAYRLRVRGLKAQERQLTALVADRTAALRTANDRLQQMATEDPLTGLANRRRFDEFLQHEWRRAQRAHSPLAVLVLDVDHFKAYNDTYGHQAGDECLRRVAGAIAGIVRRGTDLAARYGGEEFSMVLTATAPEHVPAVAESVRAAVESMAIAHRGSANFDHVTVSIGVASRTPGAGSSPDELVRAADRALYSAKERGRNRVV